MKTKFWGIFAAASVILSATACEPEEKVKEVVFPTVENVSLSAGENREVAFSATHDWTLSSDQSWCVFDDNGVMTSTISGDAGDVVVTIAVNEDGLDFNSANAVISMAMEGKNQDIFTVTRAGKERVCELYYVDGDRQIVKLENGINISYINDKAMAESFQIGFKANFPWKVKSVTDGIDLDFEGWTGVADAELTTWDMEYVSVKEDALVTAFEGKITVSDTEGENEFEFAVNYAGFGDNDIFVATEGISNSGVNFSADAHLYKTVGMDQEVTEETTYSFSVLTKDMQSKYLAVEVVDYTPQIVTADWIKLESGENGLKTLSVAENSDVRTRTVYLLFFPSSTDLNSVNLSDYFDSEGNFNMNRNGFMVSQKGVTVSAGYKLMWGSYQPFDCTIVPFSEYKEFYEDGKPVQPSNMGFYQSPEENTYVCEIPAAQLNSLIIAPMGYPGEAPVEFTKVGTIDAPEGFMEHSALYDMSDWSQYPGIMLNLPMLEAMAGERFMFNVDTFLSKEDMENWGVKAFASIIFVIIP